MDDQIQVVTVPVTDVDQAAAFYSQQAGFALDVDYHPAGDFRVVQLTPPGSACSVQFGVGLTDAAPGSGFVRGRGGLLPSRRAHWLAVPVLRLPRQIGSGLLAGLSPAPATRHQSAAVAAPNHR